MPKVSIVIPVYNMDNAAEFLKRNLDSIKAQTFTDYEIVVSDDSDDDFLKIITRGYKVRWVKNKGNNGMANNTNNAIEHARGDLIKILFQDDYFAHPDALQDIVEHFTPSYEWLVTACTHSIGDGKTFNDHQPYYQESENSIGSPSVVTFRRTVTERFDPQFHWVLDLDWYKRLFRKYGKPKILERVNVVIGIGTHQKTNLLSDARKQFEHVTLKQKYDTSTKTNL